MRNGNGLAVLLIAIGVVLILMKTGLLGWLIGLLIPILIIGLGVMAWRNGNRVVGGILGAVGALVLLGKLSFLFVWVAAIALIVFGVSLIRRKPSTRF